MSARAFFYSSMQARLATEHAPPYLIRAQKEPIVCWSILIGAIGLAMPLVVPPIREIFTPTKAPPQPTPSSVARALVRPH